MFPREIAKEIDSATRTLGVSIEKIEKVGKTAR